MNVRCQGSPARAALRVVVLLAALLLALPALAGAEDYGCLEYSNQSCLQDGRFKVRANVSYVDPADSVRKNKSARIRDALVGDAASLFYFFTFDNPSRW